MSFKFQKSGGQGGFELTPLWVGLFIWGVKASPSSSCSIRPAHSAHFWWPSWRPGAHLLWKAGKSQSYEWRSILKPVRQNNGWVTYKAEAFFGAYCTKHQGEKNKSFLEPVVSQNETKPSHSTWKMPQHPPESHDAWRWSYPWVRDKVTPEFSFSPQWGYTKFWATAVTHLRVLHHSFHNTNFTSALESIQLFKKEKQAQKCLICDQQHLLNVQVGLPWFATAQVTNGKKDKLNSSSLKPVE